MISHGTAHHHFNIKIMADINHRHHRTGKTETPKQLQINKDSHKVELLELRVQQLEESLRNAEERLREERRFSDHIKQIYETKVKEINEEGVAEYQKTIEGLK